MAADRPGHYHSAMRNVLNPGPAAQGAEAAFEILPGDVGAGLILLCDHASSHVPVEYASLGLPPSEFERHIAYDIGAAALTRTLATRFGVPAVLSHFSRLLIDPNRGLDDPTLIMRLSDGAVVPGNARIDRDERERRIARFYQPYDDAVNRMIEAGMASGRLPMILSIHSFTPLWKGRPRPWHAGILWDADPRLARPLIAGLAGDPAIVVGDNEPYHGALKGDTLYRHATKRGLAHALVEIRQDLIADPAGVNDWADRLASVLRSLEIGVAPHQVEFFGSLTGPLVD
jgi:predicted N-formylglutamate amidohydrolase